MPEMSHPLTHMFMISTVYVGMPLGSGAVGPWFITISDLLHFSPHIRFGSIFPFPAQNPQSFLFQNQIKFSLSKLQTLFLLFGKLNDGLLCYMVHHKITSTAAGNDICTGSHSATKSLLLFWFIKN